MEDQSTASLVAVTTLATVLALATLCGCKATNKKAVIETKVPNVWASEPVQSIAIRMEMTL
jgi:hypothetical protein|tara:strand:+ start:351 stop:533 length:183 start_codon:yes stop_codon:yes gene_type:complete